MEITEYLKDEMTRLKRINDLLEKKIEQGQAVNNEPEQILKNVLTMCEIADMLYKFNKKGEERMSE